MFINPSITDHRGISVIRCVHAQRPLIPIFLLCNKDLTSPFSPQELKQLGVRKTLSKPVEYSYLIELVAPFALSFDGSTALQKAKTNPDKLDQESASTHESFQAIRAQDFLSGAITLFDVYVRLKSGRFVKILQGGDSFTVDRVENYLKKGTTHFFILREVQKEYLDFCDHLVTHLAKQEKIPVAIKLSQTLHLGTQVYDYLKNRGIDEANLRYANGFVNHALQVISQLQVENIDTFVQFSRNIAVYEHSVATTMLTAILAKKLEVNLPKPAQILGVASMFHDIGFSASTDALDKNEETIDHALKSADILRNVHGIEPLTVQAVEQHHFYQNKNKSTAGLVRISKMSEIIGICDKFDRLIRAEPHWLASDFSTHFEKNIFEKFSRQIVYAFRTAFFPKA